jgi:hypothetical protein
MVNWIGIGLWPQGHRDRRMICIVIPLDRAPRTERGQLHTAQVVNLLVGMIALVFALSFHSLLDILTMLVISGRRSF